jgi:transcriptional regulator with XRE-family HTH domain
VASTSTAQLGEALKDLRRQRGHSLNQVSEATGISRSFLSLVESGRSDITIGRLLRLVTFYGAHISDLLPQEEPHDPVVVRRDEQREVKSLAEGMRVFLLAPDIDRRMTPSLGVIEPRGASAERATHEGEEFIYVLDGVIELEIADRDLLRLEKGDSAYFRADRPHAYKNTGSHPAKFVSVASPPTF